MRSALYRYGRPMWNLAIMYLPRSIDSATAVAGETGRRGSIDRAGTGVDGEAAVSKGVLIWWSENWRAGGRLRRHCST